MLNTNNLDDVYTLGVTLQISAFNQGQQYPNGYIASGIVLGAITAASTNGALVCGPYDPGATDGRQNALGLLFSSVRVWTPLGQPLVKVGGACVVAWGVIGQGRLPFGAGAGSRTVTDGVENGTTTVTSATAAFVAATDVGQPISGAGVPAGTTIASVTNATTAVMSAAATQGTTTASVTGVSLTIGGRGGGALDAAARTALRNLYFTA